jgi:6-phosphogluconolactonase (cycloisomerase 2 family)
MANVGGSIGEYTVSAASATPLTSIGTVAQAPNPLQTFLHPSGKYLYSIDISANSAIWVYDVNASTGVITFSGVAPIQAGSGNSNFGVVDPFGRFLYVIDSGTTSIYGFTISPTDGTLTLIPGAPFPFPSSLSTPQGIVVDHTGQFVYVTNFGSGTVSAYSIDQTTGVLSELSPATISAGAGPEYPAIDPTGKYLYVPNNSDQTVSAFSIGANGQLTSLGSNTTITGSSALLNLVVDPSGSFLYVLDADTATGQVFTYNLNSDGTIGTVVGSPVPVGGLPTGIAVDPTGVLLAVDNNGDNTISLFSISGGTLTAKSPATVGTDVAPEFLIFFNAP